MDIYIIQSSGTIYSNKIIGDGVRDGSDNIVCWDKKVNAEKYTKAHFNERNIKVTKKDFDEYQKEINNINIEHGLNIRLRIFSGIDFDDEEFFKVLYKEYLKKFKGNGTFFICDIINIINKSDRITHGDVIEMVNSYFEYVDEIISKHNGLLLEHEGDAVIGYWIKINEPTNHCQHAFNAAKEILTNIDANLKQYNMLYEIEISLGTGQMAGDHFGIAHQFQVVGQASAIARKLNKFRSKKGSVVRFTQYTLDLINKKDRVEQLEDKYLGYAGEINIYEYSPVVYQKNSK
ncbi:MAG: adenylate/guanylate cyclase domain-containing protein [Leptospirales bacterium]